MDHLITDSSEDILTHKTPSIGSVVKKMLAINPELTTSEMIQLIRQSIRTQAQSGFAGDFAQAEIIDEANALQLARASLA